MRKALVATALLLLSIAAHGQSGLKDLNVDFMMRGYFYAGSKIEDKQAPGGFGPSGNFPKAVTEGRDVRRGRISLVVLPGEESTFAKQYLGLKVLLINGTGRMAAFDASDSRLSIVQEALDRDGRWKPVEYLPSSWCGNSYHTVFLGPSEYWEFDAARYTGRFRTKLRVKLTYGGATLYSNEYDGGVNPKQFTVQQGHNPTGIMDPYDN